MRGCPSGVLFFSIVTAKLSKILQQYLQICIGVLNLRSQLLQYKGTIRQREKANVGKKIFGLVFFVIVLSGVAMEKEYKDYMFHVRGACIGIVLGLVVALLSGCIIHFCFAV